VYLRERTLDMFLAIGEAREKRARNSNTGLNGLTTLHNFSMMMN
jgi:hypothetical protein